MRIRDHLEHDSGSHEYPIYIDGEFIGSKIMPDGWKVWEALPVYQTSLSLADPVVQLTNGFCLHHPERAFNRALPGQNKQDRT
ncbi:MAG: hypothetical protein AB1331_05395 [Bacillota bacterium]